MNSSKNMIVAILLLGVSYGVYQVITSPEQKISPDTELTISTPDKAMKSSTGENKIADLTSPPKNSAPALPQSRSFDPPNQKEPKADSATKKEDDDPLITQKGSSLQQNENGNSFESFTANTILPDFPATTPAPRTANMRPIAPKPNDFVTGNDQPAEKRNESGFGNLLEGIRQPVLPTEPITNVLQKVEQLCNEQQFREALEILTPYYRAKDLSDEERRDLYDWLDALAGKVIFSSEHLLVGTPYFIQADDTLDTIAKNWKVSTNLIYNVNKGVIKDPMELVPGAELKHITGPFVADVDCQTKIVTLYVDDLYAGRFSMVSCDANLPTGNFRVIRKTPRDPAFGQFVVEFDSGFVFVADEGKRLTKAITFHPQDARDLNEILSGFSTVTVR